MTCPIKSGGPMTTSRRREPISPRRDESVLVSAGRLACWATLALLGLTINVRAYEVATHAAITREAMMKSQLNPADPNLLQRLGVADWQTSLGESYLDILDDAQTVTRLNDPIG